MKDIQVALSAAEWTEVSDLLTYASTEIATVRDSTSAVYRSDELTARLRTAANRAAHFARKIRAAVQA